MKTAKCICLLVAALLGLADAGFGQNSSFFFYSSPLSWIGQGENFTASAANGFTITAHRNLDNGVSLNITSPTRYWSLDFAAAGDAVLTPGQYNTATIWPTQGPFSPGMNFAGNGRMDSSLIGYFNVLAIEFGTGNTVNRFDADFLQYDEGQPSAWNQGSIRFVGFNPVPEPGTVSILVAGVLALFAMNWRRRAR
jgi:hypothetical protein